MKKTRFGMVAVIVACVAASLAAHKTARASATAEVFWRCASGYAFETSGSAVHCKKPQWDEQRTLGDCPIGLYPAVDRLGTKDMCAATNPISGEIDVEQGCRATDVVQGFSKKIVSGKDYCVRVHPAEVIAPNVLISLS